MEILLVRHALPQRREVTDGPADPELDPRGRAQADLLADYLADERVDAIYSSPLRRARETAAPVASRHSLATEFVDGIAEWDRSSNAYVPLEELRANDDPRWRAMVEGRWESHEETLEEFHDRVITSIDDIARAHRSDRVVVVCHGGVINAYLGSVLRLPPSMGFFYPNYTSVHRVAVGPSGARSIIAVNETGHLRGSDLLLGLFDEVPR